MANQNNLFAGRTKNEIRHAYFCAELFGTSVEEQLKQPVSDPNMYDKGLQFKWDRIDAMTHEQYMGYVREQMD